MEDRLPRRLHVYAEGFDLQAKPHIVDLFCGCGGFALGAHAAGFSPTIAFDVDPILTSSLARNFPSVKLVVADLTTVTGRDIETEVGGSVLGVFGGPPCQAFSDIGHRKADDPRRALLGHFFRLVAELRPAFFVMENVRGLGYCDTRPVLDEALDSVAGAYDFLGPVVLDAADYGAATSRRRLFVVGWDRARCDPLAMSDLVAGRRPAATVRDAIGDLGSAMPRGEDEGFDLWQLRKTKTQNDYRAALRTSDLMISGHRRTAHAPEIVSRFRSVAPGAIDPIGRHPRLAWSGQCPTLRAGTGNDRGSYQSVRPIHPSEPRVVTVREAARMQGFPDWFRFHPTIWHSFRMIGNSVSPVMAHAVLSMLRMRTDTAGRVRDRQAAE